MDRDKLLALIKKETGVRLDVEDPVLAVAIVHDKMLEVALERIEASAQRAAAQIAVAVGQGMAEAQNQAGRIVTDAGRWGAEQLRDVAGEIAAIVLHETQAEVAKAEAAQAAAIRAAWISGGVSLAGCAIVGGMVIAALVFA